MVRHRTYYKGEGDGFPQVQIVVSLVSSWLPMARPCTKMFQLRINQLVIWFVHVHVRVNELLVNIPSPIPEL